MPDSFRLVTGELTFDPSERFMELNESESDWTIILTILINGDDDDDTTPTNDGGVIFGNDSNSNSNTNNDAPHQSR